MISDFQRNGWVRDESLRLPEGTTFTPGLDYRCADREPDGLVGAAAAVAVLRTGADHGRSRRRQSRSRGGEQRAGPPRARRTKCRNADRFRRSQASRRPSHFSRSRWRERSRAAPCESATTSSSRTTCSTSSSRPPQRLPVFILEPPRASREASLFLQKALRIGTAPAFQVNLRQGESISSADLDRHRVVILNDAAALASGEHPEGVCLAGRRPVRDSRRARQFRHRLERSAAGRSGERCRSPGPRRIARRARLQPSNP